ncbi:hypothetical protein SLEP1_g16740 [Rubroshorea leprosula]|uniref:Integrase catalytic domain-containing protein n=1 Tax=Rubroshorea leprosula TaxID=152421 RepID=A0AAV5IRT3_9ROSI|nr:hypothetical protein SLEP1_g16740 [Rubroshorea leprosula]
MQVHQKEGESLRDYMQRFNKIILDIDNVLDTICLSALLHGLKRGRFLDDLLENPPKTWNEVNDRSQILAQIQHWVRRPPPPLHDSPRADKSKHCDYHRVYGHNTEDCQHLKDELEFLARNERLEGYDNQYPSEQGRAYRGRQFNRRGQGQRTTTQNQKDKKWVGYVGIPPLSGTINMISGGIHSRGQSARGRKAYARHVMTVNKNRPLKRPFEKAEWENTPITFSSTDYQRAKGEPDVMMPHADPFVAMVHIEPRFRMASINFLVVKMESAFNAILGRVTLCELKAVISQPHLCMKFPTPQGVGVLKGNQKMARACYQDTFKKVEFAVASRGSGSNRPTQPGQQTMSISDIEHRPKGVEQKEEPVEPFLRVNQDVFAWTTDEMPGIPAELIVHKLSTDPTKRPVVQKRRLFGLEKQVAIDEEIQKLLQAGFIKRVEYSEWVSNPVLVKKPNGKWRMCIDFTNLNEACPKDPHPLPNVEKLVERATGHEWMSFLDASSGYHQVQLLLDDQEKIAFYTESGKFLGYVVSKKGIEVNREKVQAVQQMEPPRTVKDVQRLTGRVAVLHRFIASIITLIVQACGGREFIPVSRGYRGGDFLVECISATTEEKAPEHPVWVLYVDGAANIEGSGAGTVLVGPDGFKSEHALRFKFQTTNNAAEYEALIYGLKLASKLKVNRLKSGFISFQIDKIPRADNHRADELSKLASSQDLNPQRSTIVEVLDAPSYIDFTIECQLLRIDPSSPSWTTPLIDYLQTGEVPEDPSATKLIKRRAAHLLDNQLYKQAASMPLLRCLTPYEAEYAVREVHEGVCGTHIGGRTLARKLLRHGYYWPTMVEDAQSYVKKCPTCQLNADDIHMPGEMLSSLSSPWPFARWGVDLLGPFVKGKGGCTHLVVAVDYFNKWIEAKPLSTTTKKKIEKFLFNLILCRFGIPKRIIADNGP